MTAVELTFRSATVDDVGPVLDLWVEAGAHPTSTDDAAVGHHAGDHAIPRP